MKQIAVVAREKPFANYLRDNLAIYFEPFAEIHPYSLSELEAVAFIAEEYVLVSAFYVFQQVKAKVRESSELVMLSMALTKENTQPLEALPKRAKALLVNIDSRTCTQVITNLYSVGFRELELYPYWGNGELDPAIRVAITTGEAKGLVPAGMEEVICIGDRVIDLDCMLETADKLGISQEFRASKAFESTRNLFYGTTTMERMLGENENLGERIDALIELMDQGIIITDTLGKIHLANGKARRLLAARADGLTGFDVIEILPEARVAQPKGLKEELVEVDGKNLVITVNQIRSGGEIRGNIIVLDSFDEIEQKQHHIRSRLSEVNHTARYRFEDIRGESESIRTAVEMARRMARSEASVLITGESGTGKEVLAQSIHNSSARCHYNFVAVNCAAIPENLLESEMFGYEEGSFTGAKKGGKAGFFEIAHKGTIFLDEIGEMPLLLQTKLLRVIEERKVIRLGSAKVVDIDVRIIAATNKDLFERMEAGLFREDLYYRLNVLPLAVPALRQRKSDVMGLAEHFMELLGCRLSFRPEARAAMESYNWRGNVRELRNVVEYLTALEITDVQVMDLPFLRGMSQAAGVMTAKEYLCLTEQPPESGGSESAPLRKMAAGFPEVLPKAAPFPATSKRPADSTHFSFLVKEGKHLELLAFILETLAAARAQRRRAGRAALSEAARQRGYFYTEQEIRRGLSCLAEEGFVRSERGRGGSVITEKGVQLLVEIRTLQSS